MKRLAVIILIGCGMSCTQKLNTTLGVLIDTSGTYTDEIPDILVQIRLRILPNLNGGDKLVVMMIDSSSYDYSNVVTTINIPKSRREAADLKSSFAKELQDFKPEPARFTDISGALMYCAELMRDMNRTSKQKILIFSDMQEDLPKGVNRSFRDKEFDGVDVAVVNTKRLAEDQKNPEIYKRRMDEWRTKLKNHGARAFKVYMGHGQIKTFIEQ